jgi:PAS domain S-box-containing protein
MPRATGRRPAEEESAGKDRTLFERLFEFSPDAITLVDGEGRIRRINAQVEAMFGYARDDLLGRPIEMLLPERFRERHVGHRSGFQSQPHLRPMGRGLELLGRRKDGSEFPVDIMLSPVRTGEGSFVLGVVRDVTERRRIEQALHEKNAELEKAMHAKDQFLATMSHELRTPLNAIIGFTGTLLMKLPGPLTADQERQLHTIGTSARHLLSLINDLLDLVKVETGGLELKFEAVACEKIVEEAAAALRPLADSKGIGLAIEVPRHSRKVRTDQRAVLQILLNLGNNAIKFTDSGEINIRLRQRDDVGGLVTELNVADTGQGISEEEQAKLFRAFGQLDTSSTRRHEGTGLGLYLSRKLAELIGGRISVRSESGKGSVFTLTIEEK